MKKEALEVLKNRRCIRNFKDEQISENELDCILESGVYAPNGMGTQDPIIIAIQNKEVVSKIDELNAKILNMEQLPHPYYGAPTILFVIAPKDSLVPVEDCSLVAGNIMNSAYALGIGSCWVHRAKEIFETNEGKELLKNWGLDENMLGVASIALGYPNCEHPESAPRKENRIIKIK